LIFVFNQSFDNKIPMGSWYLAGGRFDIEVGGNSGTSEIQSTNDPVSI
jgi:hypothetical protein